CCYGCFFFFFSSRRRHTRSKRDWSSDVCSSDLGGFFAESLPTTCSTKLFLQKPLHFAGICARIPFATLVRPVICGSAGIGRQARSEERRVGKEGRSRGGTDGQQARMWALGGVGA